MPAVVVVRRIVTVQEDQAVQVDEVPVELIQVLPVVQVQHIEVPVAEAVQITAVSVVTVVLEL